MRALTLAAAAAAMLAWQGAIAAPPVPEGEPLAVEATALVPLDDEKSLSIAGIEGQILISGHDAKELKVVSRSNADGAEVPVGIWQTRDGMIVAAAPGAAARNVVVRIEIPRAFAVTLTASRSDVVIEGAEGGVTVEGDTLRANLQSCGPVTAEVTGGSLNVADSRDTTVRAKDAAVTASAMQSAFSLHVTGGEANVANSAASFELETEEAKVVIDGAAAAVHVKANHGTVVAKGLAGGGEFQIAGAPLKLHEGKGDITVTSDASVEFTSMAASLHLDLFGGNLRGKDNEGILEVRTRNSEINVEGIDQGMRVSGDGIHAKIVDVAGELYVEAAVSDFVVDKIGDAEFRLDRGSLTVQRATGAVKATVVGGDVHMIDGSGPVQLDLDGGDAELSWSSLSAQKDSQIVNKSGSVTLRFPPNASGRVEAKAKYGRIDSTLVTVRVSDDQKEAQGPLSNGSQPIIRVVAQQDIHLVDAATAPADEN